MTRPSWEEYALTLADAARARCEDPYVQVGAVALRPDWSVAGVGYNGAPSGIELDWSDREARRQFIIHAEVNALRYTTPAEMAGGIVAVSGTPCPVCLTHIAAYGVHRVLVGEELDNYPFHTSNLIAGQLGIELELWT